jgi:glycosyltransferase involved in cell wall biosynthesis
MREVPLTVVIPAHQEVGTIASVVAGVRAASPAGTEILVVDDGSTDGTAEAARGADAEVLPLEPNRGKGVALREGIRAARGELLLFIDADGQDDPGELPRLLGAMAPDVAMVIGSRFLGTLRDGSITPLHRLGNRTLTGVFNLLYRSQITDTQAGFRLLRREAVDLQQLRAVRYEIETELTLHVLRRGGRVIEVPVTRSERGGGRSGFGTWRDGMRVLRRMVSGRLERVRA